MADIRRTFSHLHFAAITKANIKIEFFCILNCLQTPMWMSLPRWCPPHTLDGGTSPQKNQTGHNRACFTWKQGAQGALLRGSCFLCVEIFLLFICIYLWLFSCDIKSHDKLGSNLQLKCHLHVLLHSNSEEFLNATQCFIQILTHVHSNL